MILTRENVKSIANPSDKIINRDLRRLKSYRNSTFAALTADDGSYIQVGGGSATCVLERKDSLDNRRYRAWQDTPIVPPQFDGAILIFSSSRIALKQAEWFRIDQVIETFIAFKNSAPLPNYIHWREICEVHINVQS